MGKPIKLTKDYVIQGVTISAGTVGELVSNPGRDDSPMASQPDQEHGTVKVFFPKHSMEIGVPIDRMPEWFEDVPADTVPL